MRIKPEIGSVVGPSDETHWGQTIISPTAYGVVELASSDARRDGIELLTKLGDLLNDPPVSLKDLEYLSQDLFTPGVKTIILLVPVGPVVYLVVSGMGAVYVHRDNTASCLLSGAGALSGEVKPGDTLLLVSDAVASAVSAETIVGLFDHLSPSDIAEKFTLTLHKTHGGLGSAALIFQVKELIDAQEEVVEGVKEELPSERPMKTIWRFSRHVARRLPRIRLPASLKLSPVVIILLALFGVSIVFGIIKKSQTSTNKEVVQALTQAQHSFEEGTALIELNPVKGRERLAQAKEVLDPFVSSLSPRSTEGREVKKLYDQIVDSLTTAMHVVTADPALFFDMSLIKKGGQADSFSLFSDTLGILDAVNHSVYTLNIGTKNSQIVGGGESMTGATLLTAYADKLYVLTQNGIATIRLSDKKTIPDTIPKSAEWGTISSIVAYGGNLYLLDKEKSRIWKYVTTETGFSELREYLNPDSLPDLSKATAMAIDGSIFVGTSDGKILRFTQGKENTFTPQGITPALGSYLVIYTSDTVKNVYVFDRDNKRIVVLDKDGAYLAQYSWGVSLPVTQLAVSESEKKILLLASGKIYALELK